MCLIVDFSPTAAWDNRRLAVTLSLSTVSRLCCQLLPGVVLAVQISWPKPLPSIVVRHPGFDAIFNSLLGPNCVIAFEAGGGVRKSEFHPFR